MNTLTEMETAELRWKFERRIFSSWEHVEMKDHSQDRPSLHHQDRRPTRRHQVTAMMNKFHSK